VHSQWNLIRYSHFVFRFYSGWLFAKLQKGSKKNFLCCAPDIGPKSLYAAALPDRMSVAQTRSGYATPRWTGSKARYQLLVVVKSIPL